MIGTQNSKYFCLANMILCIVVLLGVGAFFYGLYYTEISYADTIFCDVYNNKILALVVVLILVGTDWSFYRKLPMAERKDVYPIFLITAFVLGGGMSILFVARMYHLCVPG